MLQWAAHVLLLTRLGPASAPLCLHHPAATAVDNTTAVRSMVKRMKAKDNMVLKACNSYVSIYIPAAAWP
jgi:hypothetical protein